MLKIVNKMNFIFMVLFIPLSAFPNNLPYLVVSPIVTSAHFVNEIKYSFSFDTLSKCRRIGIDSTFSCSSSSCFWEYDTVYTCSLTAVINKTSDTSFNKCNYYIKYFAFFDTENDSCKIIARAITNDHTVSTFPDSLWGDTYTNPGYGKSIALSFFRPNFPSNSHIELLAIQNNQPNDSALLYTFNPTGKFDTLKNGYAIDSTIARLNGTWQWFLSEEPCFKVLGGSIRYSNPSTTSDQKTIIIMNDSVYFFSKDHNFQCALINDGVVNYCNTIDIYDNVNKLGTLYFMGNYLEFAYPNGCANISSDYFWNGIENIDRLTFINKKNPNLLILPNPSRFNTKVQFYLPNTDVVDIWLVDIRGKSTNLIYHDKLLMGQHQILIKCGFLSQGIYFVKIRTLSNNQYMCSKLVVLN